jgi:hypothetical protein
MINRAYDQNKEMNTVKFFFWYNEETKVKKKDKLLSNYHSSQHLSQEWKRDQEEKNAKGRALRCQKIPITSTSLS